MLYIIAPITIVVSLITFIYIGFIIMRKEVRIIQLGDRDKLILNTNKSKRNRIHHFVTAILTAFLLIILIILTTFALIINTQNNTFHIASFDIKLVASNSMATINDNNTYLHENELHNQFRFDDIIILSALPKEEDLNLYDIVTYMNQQGHLVIHRIVEIDVKASGTEYRLRGDANRANDPQVFTYDDFVSIYHDQKILFVGSFVRFLQSWIGIIALSSILCIWFIEQFYYVKVSKAIEERKKLYLDDTYFNDMIIETEETNN